VRDLQAAGADASAVTVYFNGIPAPAAYVSTTQINAIVPNDVSGLADVVVDYQGTRTYAFPLGLTSSAPEIFAQEDGSAQGVAVNQDGSFNSPSSAAARGSMISFWATGQGLVDSSSPNPRPQLAVSVSIGGVNAEVAFAGLVYAGVLQVNVKVPPGAPAGDAVDLVLAIGPGSSRRRAMVAVRRGLGGCITYNGA
jgi:uncharacterized protein (TIGR03437 family)